MRTHRVDVNFSAARTQVDLLDEERDRTRAGGREARNGGRRGERSVGNSRHGSECVARTAMEQDGVTN